MGIRKRKYCSSCKQKISAKFLDEHFSICEQRQKGEPVTATCFYCQKEHDCSYGPGVYCSKSCTYKDRPKKTCPKCKRIVAIGGYNIHVDSCQGQKFSAESWYDETKAAYRCPECSQLFNKMGIVSHYTKIHGPIIPDEKLHPWVKPLGLKDSVTNCIVCDEVIKGKKRKYCSKRCKTSKLNSSPKVYNRARAKGVARKLALMELSGDSCEICGYNKNLSSLAFHHLDERTKELTLDARNCSNTSFKKLYKESKKCQLLCHNCHNEVHNHNLNIKTITEEFRIEIKIAKLQLKDIIDQS